MARKTVWGYLKKLNIKLLYDSAIPFQENWNRCPNKNLYMNAHSSTICNSKKVEKTQMSINWQMDKQNVRYS